MKKIFLIAATVMMLSGNFVFATGRVVTDSLESRILGATVNYNVYLPDGFTDKEGNYPSIYLLHGLYGTYDNWTKLTRMELVADELMASGECCKAVIFMPNAGSEDIHNVQNGYFNVDGWRYEDFFFQEFIPEVESKYRCKGDKQHRAIMGLSMGGGGSTVYCQRHPDMFSSCYAMSAWLDEEFDEDMPKDKFYLTCKSVHENSALDFVDRADENTRQLLKGVHWFFDCGDDDGLLYLSVDLHRKMKGIGADSQLRVHNGAHTWEYWHNALRDALPYATRCFER